MTQQASFLNGVYSTLELQWQSPIVSQAVASPAGLLEFLGLVDKDGNVLSSDWTVDPAIIPNRGEFLSIMTTIYAITRRISLPKVSYLKQFLFVFVLFSNFSQLLLFSSTSGT